MSDPGVKNVTLFFNEGFPYKNSIQRMNECNLLSSFLTMHGIILVSEAKHSLSGVAGT